MTDETKALLRLATRRAREMTGYRRAIIESMMEACYAHMVEQQAKVAFSWAGWCGVITTPEQYYVFAALPGMKSRQLFGLACEWVKDLDPSHAPPSWKDAVRQSARILTTLEVELAPFVLTGRVRRSLS